MPIGIEPQRKDVVRGYILESRFLLLFLMIQLCVFAGFPAIGFGSGLTANFSAVPGQGDQSLRVSFTDRSAPS